jgi:hypothetical protein
MPFEFQQKITTLFFARFEVSKSVDVEDEV